MATGVPGGEEYPLGRVGGRPPDRRLLAGPGPQLLVEHRRAAFPEVRRVQRVHGVAVRAGPPRRAALEAADDGLGPAPDRYLVDAAELPGRGRARPGRG